MHWRVALTAPASTCHKAPVSNTFRGIVSIVKIGKSKQQVPKFMSTDSNFAVLGHSQIGIDLGAIRTTRTAVEKPFVGPDIVRIAGHFAARPSMNYNESVYKSVSIIVIGSKVDTWIGGNYCI